MNPKPFLKWAGGKTQLLPVLSEHIPGVFDTYYEPFVGAGALFFHLMPNKAVIADINSELINCYAMLANSETALKTLEIIDGFPINQEFFYQLRAADREKDFFQKSSAWRAARIIYLNKTCYNGLYRVNGNGEFNAPWGKYKNPKIYCPDNIKAVMDYLQNSSASISISPTDYKFTLLCPTYKDFVYLDPPYDVLTETSNFTGYAMGGFHREQQKALKECVDNLTDGNVRVLQSNADTPFIRNLYKDYEIIEVQAKRNINSNADKRGAITELLIKNY